MSIETKISPLIENMFPSFYKEDGENFIAFVKAYYEWLENNFQLLTLKSTENFNVGDTVIQGSVTGTIVSFVDSDILVLVNEFDTFKCVTICSDLTPIVSSSGGSTVIDKGGKTRRLGTTFLSRNLLTLRDVDTTMDIFLTNFKQKYLRNIDFDTATNKRLFIKNSLDLYRSKGTPRSIDLFFRLMYGVNAGVYYPGDDLFKLSEGDWYKPQYLEISCVGDSSFRAVQMIGKIITGVSSGAQAFVEKYIKHKTSAGFTHVLYITNIAGTFKRGELIRHDQVYLDSPSIIGSLGALSNLKTKSGGFNIGDIVSVYSITGINGLARVTSINDSTGAISFELVDSGWGYSVNVGNTNPTFLAQRSQTLVSDNVLFVSNVQTGNVISSISVNNPGLTYSNTDVITIVSEYSNGVARPVTNSTGGVTEIVLVHPGAGFFTASPQIVVANSIGGSTAGSGLTATFTYSVPKKSFTYLENVVQRKTDITFDTATVSASWSSGATVLVSNGSATIGTGSIVSLSYASPTTGTMSLLLANNFMVSSNNKILIASNTMVSANISSYTDTSATGVLMSIPSQGTLYTSGGSSYFDLLANDIVYQKNQSNEVVSSAVVLSDVVTHGVISVGQLSGTFTPGMNLYSSGTALNVNLVDFKTEFGVVQVNNTFITSSTVANARAFMPFTGVNFVIDRISTGVGATYSVTTISNDDTTTLNTDIVSNTISLSTSLRATQFNFPANPTANLQSGIANSLTYQTFALGEIFSLGNPNPGYDYTYEPYLLTYQPFTSGYDYRDYTFTLSNINGSFLAGEYVQQPSTGAKGIVKSIFNNTMHVKRIQFENKFNPSLSVVGSTTGATANAVINQDTNTLPVGWNGRVDPSVFTSNGVITSLGVVDSGFGFINGQEATFAIDNRTGTATVLDYGVGTGSGRYRNGKGFVSDYSKIHDGNYYQEYSYDIISRIPLDKYGEMFKKVMHTAGTKFFGSVLIDTLNDVTVKVANNESFIEAGNSNPYMVEDRSETTVEDRSSVTIEVRS